jgi:hypothetical protein
MLVEGSPRFGPDQFRTAVIPVPVPVESHLQFLGNRFRKQGIHSGRLVLCDMDDLPPVRIVKDKARGVVPVIRRANRSLPSVVGHGQLKVEII